MALKLSPSILLLALLVLLTGFSNATQVTLAESTIGTVLFTNDGGNTVDMSFTGDCGVGLNDCVSGYGLLGANIGIYKMWMAGGPPMLIPPDAFDIYGWNMNGVTLGFSMTLSGGKGTLLGDLRLEYLSSGMTRAPVILAQLTASSTTGLFDGLWPIGVEVPGDFAVNLANTQTVDLVYLGTLKSIQGPIYSGEFVTTPEPATLGLLAGGLVTMTGLLRRRLGTS